MPDPDPIPNRLEKYELPLDVVLALPTGSVMRGLIQDRRDRGDHPCPTAHVFAQGRRYFALVGFYGPNSPELLIPLDVWVWRGAGEGAT